MRITRTITLMFLATVTTAQERPIDKVADLGSLISTWTPLNNEATETIASYDIGWALKPATTIDFYNDSGKILSVDLKTGNVEIAEDLDMNEASKLFWKILQQSFGDKDPCRSEQSVCDKACSDLKLCLAVWSQTQLRR